MTMMQANKWAGLTLVTGLVSGLAMGCVMNEAADEPAVDVIDNELSTNSCKPGDSSHTTSPQATCTYAISSSNGDKAGIEGQGPEVKNGRWTASCVMTGIECGGSGTPHAIACSSPEYPATGQDITGCPPSFSIDLLPSYLGDVDLGPSSSPSPSPDKLRSACFRAFGGRLDDTNAEANRICNKYATEQTDKSKRSPVCCIPAPTSACGQGPGAGGVAAVCAVAL